MSGASGRRGSALVMSLFMVAILSLMAATVFVIIRSEARESVYQTRAAQAQAIAEAGVEDALYELHRSTDWRAGFQQKAFAGGSYTVVVSSEDPPVVTATGYSAPIALLGPVRKTVTVQARIVLSTSGTHVDWDPGTWQLGRR